jgi:hypothetical protein
VTCRANRKKKGKIKRKVFKKEEEKEKEKKKENKVGRWIRKWGIRYVWYSYVTYYIETKESISSKKKKNSSDALLLSIYPLSLGSP